MKLVYTSNYKDSCLFCNHFKFPQQVCLLHATFVKGCSVKTCKDWVKSKVGVKVDI